MYKKRFYSHISKQLKDDNYIDCQNKINAGLNVYPYNQQYSLRYIYNQGMKRIKKNSNPMIKNYYNPNEKKFFTNMQYSTKFITTHKGGVRSVRFSPNGEYVGTCSTDCSIKVLNVKKLKVHLVIKNEAEHYEEAKPIIRTYYEHSQRVNSICFTNDNTLISGSDDFTIKFYNINRKKSLHTIRDINIIFCLALHPSQEYIFVGANDHVLRLYNTRKFKAYVSVKGLKHNMTPITTMDASSDGRLLLTGGDDGLIKIWDVRTLDVIKFIKPRSNIPNNKVYSLKFSKNSKYILCGDSTFEPHLYELLTSNEIMRYNIRKNKGITMNEEPKILERYESTFSRDEKRVFTSINNRILIYNTLTGECKDTNDGHAKFIRSIDYSNKEDVFMTGSDDQRARFFCKKPEMEK